MTRRTRVPEILDELVAKLRADEDIRPELVVDGGASINDFGEYIIMVGFRPDGAEWITTTRDAPAGMRPNDIETVTVGVMIGAVAPDNDMSAARRTAVGKLAALERIVTDDPTLGLGKGVLAVIASTAWTPIHTGKAAECNIAVDLRVKVTL